MMSFTSARATGLRRLSVWVLALVILPGPGRADERSPLDAPAGDAWDRMLKLVRGGEFDAARDLSRSLPDGAVSDHVRQWLAEYSNQQAERERLNREDYDKYVRYAHERIERKEYELALRWAIQASDNLQTPAAILQEPWVVSLISAAMDEGARLRSQGKWEDAWKLYYYLGILDEREPRYEKLERECITHIRLDRMFEEGGKWDEPIRDIKWRMAEVALGYVSRFYHDEQVPFRRMAESGLEQLLILADSASARNVFDGLKSDVDRAAFRNRIQYKLDEVSAQREVDVRACTQVLHRALDINAETINLPESLVVSEMTRGAFDALDDFTSIIWPAEFPEFSKHTQGDFVGVGISIFKNVKAEIEVVTPLAFTPAYEAGVQAGDIITHVDGKPLKGISINTTVDIITGPEGTSVTLTMRRGDRSFDVTLTRKRVVIETVTGIQRREDDPQQWNYWIDRENGVGYVRVSSFARNTVDILKRVVSDLRREGMKGLVLDLRGNPGGLLDSAEQMASLFLSRNMKVHSIKGRNPQDDKEYFTRDDGPFTNVPLTVLVDESSASASEIVSGAIRDNRRGTVIGARTFGKFSVQNLIPINNNPDAALKITTARYYLPSGVSLHRDPDSPNWGVNPNIPVRLVRKEKTKYLQVQRRRDVLGPLADLDIDDEAENEPVAIDPADGDGSAGDGGAGDEGGAVPDGAVAPNDEGEDVKSGEPTAEGSMAGDGEPKEAALPQIEQPDENDRPQADPQLDTAMLFMRIALLAEGKQTLAAAQPDKTEAPVKK
ncbi:MAG: S41 family peptidase [Phycisphaerales bacterium]|nr:MAG: S41 family peptidase [Phycisphaerales bacterium]